MNRQVGVITATMIVRHDDRDFTEEDLRAVLDEFKKLIESHNWMSISGRVLADVQEVERLMIEEEPDE